MPTRPWLIGAALALALLWPAAEALAQKPKSPSKTVPKAAAAQVTDYWTEPAMTEDVLVLFSRNTLQTLVGRMAPEHARQLKEDLEALEELPVSDRTAAGTHASALMEATGFSSLAQVYAAWAVLQDPQSAVAVINLAAVTCWPPLLRLAVAREPKNPIPYTNLGSCAMSAQRWDLAREGYEQAVARSPTHRNALEGLGQWHLQHRNLSLALEYFARANGVRYEPQVAEATRPPGGKRPTPSRLIEPEHDRFGGGRRPSGTGSPGTAHVTDVRMELPPLPNWPSPDPFLLSAETRQPLAELYGARMNEGIALATEMLENNPLKKLSEMRKAYQAMTPAQQEVAALEDALRRPWTDQPIVDVVELNYQWLSDRLEQADARYAERLKRFEELGKKLEKMGEQRVAAMEAACPDSASAMATCMQAFRATMVKSCKESMAVNGQMFVTWRDAYRDWYAEVKPALEETYRVQGLWIRQISDPDIWRAHVASRSTMVFSPVAGKMIEEDAMRLVFLGLGAAAFGRTAEVCPQEPPQAHEKPEVPELPKSDDPRSSCPIQKGKPWKVPPFDIPGVSLPVSADVSCQDLTIKVKAGIGKSSGGGQKASANAVVSVKYRYGGDKSTTVFIGAESSVTGGMTGGSSLGVKGEVGVSLTFDKGGQLTDVGGRAGITETISLPGELMKGSGGVVAVIEKGSPKITASLSHQTRGGKPITF
jgi:tetratricopeptide (TPR) repeat protein